jgi:hypothetical protein
MEPLSVPWNYPPEWKHKLNAEYSQGVLDISAPIAASALRRRIEIKTTEPSKQLSATARS